MTKKIVVGCDVIFDELGSWYSPKQNVDNENEDRNKSENEKDCHGNGNGNKARQQSRTSKACVEPSENSDSKSE